MNGYPVLYPSYTPFVAAQSFLEPSQAEVDLGSINSHKMSS